MLANQIPEAIEAYQRKYAEEDEQGCRECGHLMGYEPDFHGTRAGYCDLLEELVDGDYIDLPARVKGCS